MTNLSLYLHLPYCLRKCAYCDFASVPAQQVPERYLDALCAEINRAGERYGHPRARTVFFGGGTPSLLSPQQTERVLGVLHHAFPFLSDAEVTMEANPGVLSEAFLHAALSGGVNRISMGVQALQDRLLRMLGRIHQVKDAEEAAALLARCGVRNWNADAMAGLPTQTEGELLATLRGLTDFGASHIACYSLIVEPGTPLADRIASGELRPQAEAEDRRQYRAAVRLLESKGYPQYEISNFARPGHACRHNLAYWTRQPFLGLGCAAYSQIDDRRFGNTRDPLLYMAAIEAGNSPVDTEEVLTTRDVLEETLFLGLRLNAGVTDAALLRKIAPRIPKLAAGGFVRREQDCLRLTDKGRDVMDAVVLDLMEGLDAVAGSI